jgi:hypothetical protein
MISRYVKTATLWIGSGVMVAALAVVGGLTVIGRQLAAQKAPAHPAPVHRSGGFTQPDPIDFNDHAGWVQIFDGKTLKGWDGTPDVWHVEDGAIVGESSPEHPSGTTNIIWRGGEPANFELKLEMKLEGTGANGGVQYRSAMAPPPPAGKPAKKYARWDMTGYQADFDYANNYTGQVYEQASPRGIVAWPGQMVETDPGVPHRLVAMVGDPKELKTFIKPGEWNQVEIIADSHTLIHIINGHVMSVLVDNDPEFSRARGLIAFEIEGGGVVKISHRNVWLKKLP